MMLHSRIHEAMLCGEVFQMNSTVQLDPIYRTDVKEKARKAS